MEADKQKSGKEVDVPHKLSVTLHRFIINTSIKLEDFALQTPNCVLTGESAWRCTYYGKDFTSNIFIAKKLPYYALVAMSFSKNKNFDSYKEDFAELFKKDPSVNLENFTLINWVEKFYTPFHHVSLNKLESLLYVDDDDIFIKKLKKGGGKGSKKKPAKIKSYDQEGGNAYDSDLEPSNKKRRIEIGNDDGNSPRVNMDQMRYSALALHPFPQESNFVIEIYSTGKLNVAGIPNEDYFHERVKPYINGKLYNFLKECNIENIQIDDLKDEFLIF